MKTLMIFPFTEYYDYETKGDEMVEHVARMGTRDEKNM
jgi:hypothetical protein